MKLFQRLKEESSVSVRNLIVLAGISGLSNALVLAIINAATEKIADGEESFRYLLLFIVVLAIFIVTQKRIMLIAIAEIEAILHRIRIRLADKIRQSDLEPLEAIGRSKIYASVQKETQIISQGAMTLVLVSQMLILGIFTMIYIVILSPIALILILALGAFSIGSYFRKQKQINQQLHEALDREDQLFDALTDILDGFKEVKMNRARSDELFDFTQQISQSAVELKVRTQSQFAMLGLMTQSNWYLGLGAIVFVLPRLSDTYTDVIAQVTTAILFVIGPINAIVGAFPNVVSAQVAIENVYKLESALDRSLATPKRRRKAFLSFAQIQLEGVVFTFQDPNGDSPFTVGPIDWTIRRGELILIVGGNGSGKSTLLKVLTALYYPQQGTLRLDNATLNRSSYDAYRDLFSVVFADYHLFSRLYGFADRDSTRFDARFEELLAKMGLVGKTSLDGKEFETLDLSTGQRKRLALVISLLEDKQIYVFDEWAADQDPEFKKKFYYEILPELKAQGKTVIAVTHDDRYFEVADRLVRMEEGRIVKVEPADNGRAAVTGERG